jgi:hypothetical protein
MEDFFSSICWFFEIYIWKLYSWNLCPCHSKIIFIVSRRRKNDINDVKFNVLWVKKNINGLINVLLVQWHVQIQSSMPIWSPLLSSHLYLKVTFSCLVIENASLTVHVFRKYEVWMSYRIWGFPFLTFNLCAISQINENWQISDILEIFSIHL